MLGSFDIKYLPWKAMKGQILVDLVAEFTKELGLGEPEEVRKPEVAVEVSSVATQQVWQLFVDGSANQKGSGIGIVIILPERIMLEKSLRLGFSVMNNEAEYEALQAGVVAV